MVGIRRSPSSKEQPEMSVKSRQKAVLVGVKSSVSAPVGWCCSAEATAAARTSSSATVSTTAEVSQCRNVAARTRPTRAHSAGPRPVCGKAKLDAHTPPESASR